MNLAPPEVIHKLYDVAIQGCKKGNTQLAQRALNELIVALNYDQEELAVGLFRLYDYCKRSIRQGKPEEAIGILEELRSSWAEAFNLIKNTAD